MGVFQQLPGRRFASDSFSLDGLEYPDKIIRPINGLDRHSLGSSWRHLPADEQPTLASRSYVICLALYFFP
jgi:hypothetical protein